MAGMLNNMANLANVKLTAALAATDTTVTVDDASPFQNLGDFYATLMPAGEMSRLSNSEIVLCSYATATTLAITRAQRDTTAKAFNAGDILTNGIYVEDLAQVQSVGNTIFDTMSSNNVYTLMSPSGNNMLPGIPTDGMKITIKVNYDSVGTPTIKTSSSATAFSVYTGSNVSGDDTLDPAVLLAGNIYELVFNGTAWIVLNQTPKVTSDNIDWATLMSIIETTTSRNYEGNTVWYGTNEVKFDNGLMIVYGQSYPSFVQPGNYVDKTFTLTTPFLRPPHVICSLSSNSTGASDMGKLSVVNNFSTTTQIKLRAFNGGGAAREPGTIFIAIGRWK